MLFIEIRNNKERSEHYFTAAKVSVKKLDWINVSKYLSKAKELGADDESIREFKQLLDIK